MTCQKLVLSFFAFLFFFTIVVLPVQAQENTATSSPIPSPVDYELSYPGLLPDNPFYFIKVFRDNLMGFFISKPVDKATYNLKQSDKSISASLMLIKEKKDVSLAQKSFLKGQDYFKEALNQASSAKKEGKDTDSISNQLVLASKKHLEVLTEIEDHLSDGDQNAFKTERKQAEKNIKSAASLAK